MTRSCCLLCVLALAAGAQAQLFVGLESAGVPTRLGDMDTFPDVAYTDLYQFEVSGAAPGPDGTLFLCNGAFTTRLYTATVDSAPRLIGTIGVDIHAMAYGRETLWGFSNFATPKGIYEIDQATGDTTLVLDVYTGTSFRFFALAYNPRDDLLYGYTEYGSTGLYSIDIDTGEMLRIASPPPADNTQGRGMAVGNNTVYLVATRGDDDVPFFAYDLSQGIDGEWEPFTNPYPAYHSTGGGAWLGSDAPPCPGDLDDDGDIDLGDLAVLLAHYPTASGAQPEDGDLDADGDVDLADLAALLAVYGTDCE